MSTLCNRGNKHLKKKLPFQSLIYLFGRRQFFLASRQRLHTLYHKWLLFWLSCPFAERYRDFGIDDSTSGHERARGDRLRPDGHWRQPWQSQQDTQRPSLARGDAKFLFKTAALYSIRSDGRRTGLCGRLLTRNYETKKVKMHECFAIQK